MKIIFAIALYCLVGQVALANDGTVPYIEVTGVNPSQNDVNTSVQVYGGDTKTFFDVLPSDSTMPEYSRSISFISGSYIGSIWCTKEYTRPHSVAQMDDYSCNFGYYKKNQWNDPLSPEAESDSYNLLEAEFSWKTMEAGHDIGVTGIYPIGIKVEESWQEVYSFYGKQAHFVAERVISSAGGYITMASRGYTVELRCVKNYNNPVTEDAKEDYKCSLNIKRN